MSRFRKRLIRTITAALAVSAIAAPVANAITAEEYRGALSGDSNAATGSGGGGVSPTVTSTVDDGFDFGSAAIGAGSATALLLVAGAGGVALSRRHREVGAVS